MADDEAMNCGRARPTAEQEMGPGTDLDKKVSPCVINRASDLKGIV